MFVYPLPSILTYFHPILIENPSNPIRIKSKSIYFPCLGSLAGVIKHIAETYCLSRRKSVCLCTKVREGSGDADGFVVIKVQSMHATGRLRNSDG